MDNEIISHCPAAFINNSMRLAICRSTCISVKIGMYLLCSLTSGVTAQVVTGCLDMATMDCSALLCSAV